MSIRRAATRIAFLITGTGAAYLCFAASLGPISEETPPAICDIGSFISEVRCTGGYCDNMTIRCARTPGVDLGAAVWTAWVSEEGGGTRSCPANSYIAGLACRGGNCDNISLLCIEARNVRPLNCADTRQFSEEGGGRMSFFRGDAAGQRFLARGIKCSGRYCDNKRFEVCEVAIR